MTWKKQMAVAAVLFALMAVSITYAATGENLETRVGRVEVHNAPDTEAPVIMDLERGRRLKELRRTGSWIKAIIYGTTGQDGWVRESDVTPIRSAKEKIGERSEGAVEAPENARQTASPSFVLVVSGVPQAFRARCVTVHEGGVKQRITLEGNRPKSYGLDAKAVDCRIDRVDQHAGMLRAQLYGRKRSLPLGANSTNKAFGCIHVRSDGPWGKPYGRRCSRVTRF